MFKLLGQRMPELRHVHSNFKQAAPSTATCLQWSDASSDVDKLAV
jgi:hypothetical protein